MAAIVDTASQAVYLNLLPSDFDRGNAALRATHEALSGRPFFYAVGSYYRAKLSVDYMTSADAMTVNDWWRNRSALSFDETSYVGSSVAGTGSLFIANRNAPLAIAYAGLTEYWRGTIELESF